VLGFGWLEKIKRIPQMVVQNGDLALVESVKIIKKQTHG